MALHKPTQRLDFLYSSAQKAIFIRASITVELDVSEFISQPINQYGINPSFRIDLNVMGKPNQSQEGWYNYPITFLIKIHDNYDPAVETDDVDTMKKIVRDHLAKTMADRSWSEYTVITKTITAGDTGGEVNTTISTNGDIELE